jgi:hypothetical protein
MQRESIMECDELSRLIFLGIYDFLVNYMLFDEKNNP